MLRKQLNLLSILIFLVILNSCKASLGQDSEAFYQWKLGWRMISSAMDEDYLSCNTKFDSLLNISKDLEMKFIVTGLDAKSKLGLHNEMEHILTNQSDEMLIEICTKPYLKEFEQCKHYSIEVVSNKELQLELIKIFINDQASRSNIMWDMIEKFDIDTSTVDLDGMTYTDEIGRMRIKEIFDQYGFPTRKLVGKDAMNGVFCVIQHADGDIEWQRSQLDNVKKAVDTGDLSQDKYAYLYDRIKVNNGEKQLYGTQFANVDFKNKTVELKPTEDIENLEGRRMEIGMMPIDMYKQGMLRQ